ncbi:hypothetical protein [Ruegeria sp.]|uniref:hypothetical protein n=1 Tax=Ruegeria sp. TaxID=1879320 RepID=UPI003B5C8D92
MAGKSAPRVSSITFYKHRFKKALQHYASTGGEPIEAYPKLKAQMAASNLRLAKASAAFVVVSAAFIASATNGMLNIKTTFFSFSIPAVYLLFISSILWFSVCMAVITASQLIAFSTAFKNYFGRFRTDYEMLVFLKDVDLDDFVAPPYHDVFLEPSRWAHTIRSAIFGLIILAILTPAAAALYYVLQSSVYTIFDDRSVPLHKSLAIASLAVLAFSTLFLFSTFIPFKTKRQTNLIRWIFLTRIHKAVWGNFPPRSSVWITESNKDQNK